MVELPLFERMAACTSCSLRAGCNGVVVPATPDIHAAMIVGESPTAEDDLMGEPFSGREGIALRRLLVLADLEPHLTLAVKCRGQAADEHVKACKPWLWKEIQFARPAVVLALGKVPTRLLLGLRKSFRLADLLGKFVEVPWMKARIVPWYAASRLGMQGHNEDKRTISLFKKVKEFCNANSETPEGSLERPHAEARGDGGAN